MGRNRNVPSNDEERWGEFIAPMRKGSNMVGGTVPLCQKATNLSSPSRLRTGVHSHEKRSRMPPMSSAAIFCICTCTRAV